MNIDQRVLITAIFVQMAQDAGYTKELLLSDVSKVWGYYTATDRACNSHVVRQNIHNK